ncbi:MAG: hypothetical protein D6820_06970, partial [Lentisphaerae bacterium]
TQDTGVTSNMGLFLAWGPRIATGHRDISRHGPIPIHHIGNTAARLLGCPFPAHGTGAVIQSCLKEDSI